MIGERRRVHSELDRLIGVSQIIGDEKTFDRRDCELILLCRYRDKPMAFTVRQHRPDVANDPLGISEEGAAQTAHCGHAVPTKQRPGTLARAKSWPD